MVKEDQVIARIEAARAGGASDYRDMYKNYPPARTGLDARHGRHGYRKAGLREMELRATSGPPPSASASGREMTTTTNAWKASNFAAGSGRPGVLVAFKQAQAEALTGDAGRSREIERQDTGRDRDGSGHRGKTAVWGGDRFLWSEDNIRKQLKLPWVSFDSDAESVAPEGVFLKSNPHPRAYGNFARLLGRYVRDEKVMSLEEAIRRLTSLPAANLKLDRRGLLKAGH